MMMEKTFCSLHIFFMLFVWLTTPDEVSGQEFVTAFMYGGLGNQLFQVFNVYAYGFRHDKTSVILFDSDQSSHGRTNYWDNFLNAVKYNAITDLEAPHILKPIPDEEVLYDELQYFYNPARSYLANGIPVRLDTQIYYEPIPKYETDFLFHGYFQSPKYFEDYYDEVVSFLKLSPKFLSVKQQYMETIDFPNTVSLHFRLGDYLLEHNANVHPVLSLNYYIEGLTKLIETTKRNDWRVLCFHEADDDYYVMQSLTILRKLFPTLNFETTNFDIPDWKQMILMSLCAHNIIANSTFSWWAAYFRRHRVGLVFAPSLWVIGDNSSKEERLRYVEDLIPSDWIVIDVTNDKYVIYEKMFQQIQKVGSEEVIGEVTFRLFENDNLFLVASEFCERNNVPRPSCSALINLVESELLLTQSPSEPLSTPPISVINSKEKSNDAWVTMANTEEFVKYSLVVFQSLRDVKSKGAFVLLLFGGARYELAEQFAPGFQELNVLVHIFDLPIQPHHVQNMHYRQLLNAKNNWWDFAKIETFRLTMYDKVIFIDSDLFFIANADELFRQPDGSAADGPFAPLDSGLIVMKPSIETYNEITNIIISGSFTYDTGWFNSWEGEFNGDETTQGIFYYYYKYAKKNFNLLNRSVYNYQDVEPIPHNVKVLHFTGCDKPHRQFSYQSKCPAMVRRWIAVYGRVAMINRMKLQGSRRSIPPSLLLDVPKIDHPSAALLASYPSSKRLLLNEVFKFLEEEKVHQRSSFLGVRFGQPPFDAIAMQELLYEVKPDLIIETGSNAGGSALYYSWLMKFIRPECKIVTIEARGLDYWRAHWNQTVEVASLELWKERVISITGYSTDPSIAKYIKESFVDVSSNVLVILDSDHSYDTLLNELRVYSKFVSVNSFIVVQDAHFAAANRAREMFLTESFDFEIDYSREDLLFTAFPSGFLKRISRLSSVDMELKTALDAEKAATSSPSMGETSQMPADNTLVIPAFIIALNESSPTFLTTKSVAAALGCSSIHFVRASTPDLFQSKAALIEDTFGKRSDTLIFLEMSVREISLVHGHKRTLQQISTWPGMLDEDWAIILEEDVTLHPDLLMFSLEETTELLSSTIQHLKANKQNGILYLGACDPKCEKYDDDRLLASKCASHCTHAYAVTKSRARDLFNEAYECEWNLSICSKQCKHLKCHIDQAYLRLGEKMRNHPTKNNWMLGSSLRSPDASNNYDASKHYGVVYQPHSTDYISALEDEFNYDTRTTENNDNNAPGKILIGIGTGRCGTQSLAYFLNAQRGAFVTHKVFNSCEHIPWVDYYNNHTFIHLKSKEFLQRMKNNAVLNSPSTDSRTLLGDVAFWHLPYIEGYLQDPDVFVVGIIRSREDTIASFDKWFNRDTGGLTPSFRHFPWTDDDTLRQAHDYKSHPEYDFCYPSYDFTDYKHSGKALTVADGCSLYYDDYIKRMKDLACLYPERVFLYDSYEILNNLTVQAQLLDAIGAVKRPYRRIYVTDTSRNRETSSSTTDAGLVFIEDNLKYLRENPSIFSTETENQASSDMAVRNMFLFEGERSEYKYLQAKALDVRKRSLFANFYKSNEFCQLFPRMDVAQFVEVNRDTNKTHQVHQSESESVRILCVIITYADNHRLAAAAAATWGRRCDGFLAFSEVEDISIPTTPLNFSMEDDSYYKLWEKKMLVYKEVWRKYFDISKFDYVFFGDDDTHVLVPNLREYLATDPRVKAVKGKGTYVGRRYRFDLRDGFHDFFNAGGSGYVLDATSLESLVNMIESNSCRDKFNLTSTQADQNTANCLAAAGIFPVNTLDSSKAQRFHQVVDGRGGSFDARFCESSSISKSAISLHKIETPLIHHQLDLYINDCEEVGTGTEFAASVFDWFNQAIDRDDTMPSSDGNGPQLLLLYEFYHRDSGRKNETIRIHIGDSWEQFQFTLVHKWKVSSHSQIVSDTASIIGGILDTYEERLRGPLLEAGLDVFWDQSSSHISTTGLINLLDRRYCQYFGVNQNFNEGMAFQLVILRKIWDVVMDNVATLS